MPLEEVALERALAVWQVPLRLQDWNIEARVVRTPWRKSGDVKIDAANKLAVLLVHETVDPTQLEEIVVHELVHVKLHALDQMIEELLVSVYGEDEDDARRSFAHGMFMDHLESTTQDLTRALLAAGGAEFERLSKPLREAVARETRSDAPEVQ